MTLAIVLRCSDGLVMATDSRVTGGTRRSADISEKFLQVNRDVGIMTYGLAEPGYSGIRNLVEDARQNIGNYTTMSNMITRARTVCTQAFNNFTQQNPGNQGVVGFIIGGYDGNDTAKFVIYSSSNQNTFNFEEQFGTWFMAAQWPLAAWLLSFFEYPGMSIKFALKVCVLLMVITGVFEPTVGGPTHIATVTIEEGFNLLHEKETAKLIEEVQPFLLALKLAWQEGWAAV